MPDAFHPIRVDQFHASHDSDEDILTVAFAEGNDPDPENYLILESGEPDELGRCYFEIGDRANSGYDGFAGWSLAGRQIVLHFTAACAQRFTCPGLVLALPDDVEIATVTAALQQALGITAPPLGQHTWPPILP
ncbi:Imm10 family immunity protein [Chitinilyticum aquatile]|uniref:Imm10 family immunity protein n=1 Tax=Chitinilyticum aquatile TaxID=362520 RepID=UPI000408C865|nr:Imm10 family immunity protein [Chitinilyticum aquatile]